jgi:putative ABC transport system substrate-binding protein
VKRREFITLLGGATAAWPIVARAQQPSDMRRIAVLMGYVENDPETEARLAAFRQRLERRGWVEGRNVHMRLASQATARTCLPGRGARRERRWDSASA